MNKKVFFRCIPFAPIKAKENHPLVWFFLSDFIHWEISLQKTQMLLKNQFEPSNAFPNWGECAKVNKSLECQPVLTGAALRFTCKEELLGLESQPVKCPRPSNLLSQKPLTRWSHPTVETFPSVENGKTSYLIHSWIPLLPLKSRVLCFTFPYWNPG